MGAFLPHWEVRFVERGRSYDSRRGVSEVLTEFECVADTLGPFPFGFLSKELDVPQFSDVAHMRACTWTHVNTVADLDDAEFLHARREEIHVGPVSWHDGVDFIASHHGVRNLQPFINSFVSRCNEVAKHGFIKGNGIEINTGTVGMDLIAYGSNTIKHLVSEAADEVLSRVHAHVSVACLPINGAANLVPYTELMVLSNLSLIHI